MTVGWIELVAGGAITAATLLDIFATILVPGRARGGINVAVRLRQLGLPVSRALARNAPTPGTRPGNGFAPTLFILISGTWMLLLLVGYGLMFHACASLFTPPLTRFSQATYVAGSSLLTLGVSEVDAHGAARWLILLAGLSGFGVVTVVVSFVLQIQSALQRREPQVVALGAIGGGCPSGITILETFGRLGMQDGLCRFFDGWRAWFADVATSHTTYPALVYFHSTDTRGDWLTSMEAVLDAATIAMALLEGEPTGPATLAHRVGAHTAAELATLFGLDPEAEGAALDGDDLGERLARAGYQVRSDLAAGGRQLAKLRGDYAGRIAAVSSHVGAARSRT